MSFIIPRVALFFQLDRKVDEIIQITISRSFDILRRLANHCNRVCRYVGALMTTKKKCHIILAFNGVLKHETVPRTFHPICFIFTMHFWGTNHECKSRHGELAQNTKVYRFVEFQALVY